MSEIYMMVTICNRKQMQKFVKFYKQNHVDTGNISLAMAQVELATVTARCAVWCSHCRQFHLCHRCTAFVKAQ